MSRLLQAVVMTVVIALFASPALAHVGHDVTHTALSGLLHPLSGLDHILAMVANGLLAFSLGGLALWLVPLAFVVMMAAGGVLGASGVVLPGIEQGIAASVLILGILLIVASRLPMIFAVLLAGAFAVFHGAAHGLEGAEGGAVPLSYFVGFLVATLLLHCAGIGLGATFNASRKRLAAGASKPQRGVR